MIAIFWVGSLFGEFVKIEDFETYTAGEPPAGASMPGDGIVEMPMPNPEESPWWNDLDVEADRATNPSIRVVEDPFNLNQGNVLEIYPGVPLSTSSLNHTITRSLADDQAIQIDFDDVSQVSTFYFRVGRPLVNGVPGEADLTWGMTAEPEGRTNEDGSINRIHAYGSYTVLGRIEANGGIDIRDGGNYINLQDTAAGEAMETQTWYEIWFVVNPFNRTFEQYIKGGTNYPEQTKMTWDGNPDGNAAFRNQLLAPLDTILFITSAGNTTAIKGKDSMYVDDFYVDTTGRNLTSPGVVSGLVVLDFEDDTVGEQPNVSGASFSPSDGNTETNGAVVIDSTSDPANPLEGKSLYIYDRAGEPNGAPTHFRFPIDGGNNLPNVHLSFDFQRAYAVEEADTDTRVHVALGRAGNSLNNSDFRPFELRILNNGNVVLNSGSDPNTTTIGPYNTDMANSIDVLANSHDTDTVDYNLAGLGMGTLMPNTLHLFLNGQKMGEFDFHVTPDPANAPEIVFNMENNDLGQFALYQDTKREGGIVFDNIVINPLKFVAPPPPTEGKLVNISTRGYVGTGGDAMIGSFIIREGAQQVLIQAIVGQVLMNRGVANVLADSVLTVTSGDGMVLMVNDDWEDSPHAQDISDLWGGGISNYFMEGGPGSAALLNLEPGTYSAKVEGKDGTTGVALVEAYEID